MRVQDTRREVYYLRLQAHIKVDMGARPDEESDTHVPSIVDDGGRDDHLYHS